MPNRHSLLADFRKKVCGSIDIEAQGLDRFVVYTPFMFEDGDHFVVLLKRDGNLWKLTDEGHTLMHMEYSGVDFSTATRSRVIDGALASHRIERTGGELSLTVDDERFGDSLFSFIQGLSRISNVTSITREVAYEAFMDDFRALMTEIIPPTRLHFDWNDPGNDPIGNYTVDCMVEGDDVPWFLFGIGSDASCRLATITCLKFEQWNVDFQSVAIFRDLASVGKRSLAQLTDVVGKQFSSLDHRNRIAAYLQKQILRVSGTKA